MKLVMKHIKGKEVTMKEKMKLEKKKDNVPKFKMGTDVWIIERDLSIINKKIVGYKEVEGNITYELDVKFCNGISEDELSKTKIKAEVRKKNFLDDLKFNVGDLIVFEYTEYSRKEKTIGRIISIEYSGTPYKIKGSYNEFNNLSDEDILLKVKNEFIESFNGLQELYSEFQEKDKELNNIISLIHRKHYQIEKELKTSIKKQYSVWNWNKSKPLFKDRFCYGEDNY